MTHNNLGLLLDAMNRREEAMKDFIQARGLLARLVEQQPGVTAYQSDLAMTHKNLGLLFDTMSKWHEVLHSYQLSREAYLRLAATDRDNPSYRFGIGQADVLSAGIYPLLGARNQSGSE